MTVGMEFWNELAGWYLAKPLYLKTVLGVCVLLAAVLLLGLLKALGHLLLDYAAPRRRKEPKPNGGKNEGPG